MRCALVSRRVIGKCCRLRTRIGIRQPDTCGLALGQIACALKASPKQRSSTAVPGRCLPIAAAAYRCKKAALCARGRAFFTRVVPRAMRASKRLGVAPQMAGPGSHERSLRTVGLMVGADLRSRCRTRLLQGADRKENPGSFGSRVAKERFFATRFRRPGRRLPVPCSGPFGS